MMRSITLLYYKAAPNGSLSDSDAHRPQLSAMMKYKLLRVVKAPAIMVLTHTHAMCSSELCLRYRYQHQHQQRYSCIHVFILRDGYWTLTTMHTLTITAIDSKDSARDSDDDC